MTLARSFGSLRAGALSLLLACALALTSCATPDAPSGDAPLRTEAEYYAQQLDWRDCGDGFECATAKAPLDWQNVAESDQIGLALTRHSATGDERLGSLFVNPGGPGASGTSFVRESLDRAVSPEVQEAYDVIGWDPRGVADPSAMTCVDAAGLDDYLFALPENEPRTDAWIEELRQSSAAFGEECLATSGELLANVDTVSTARDLDMLRAVVGDSKLNYIGYSYGTLIGAYYAELFASNVGRLVLDGAVNPEATIFDTVLFQTKGFEASLTAYLTWCLERSDCPFTGTVEQSQRAVANLLEKVEKTPLPGEDGRMLGTSTLLTAIIFPLYDEGNWPYLNQLFEGLKTGDTYVAFALADAYFSRNDDGTYADHSNEAFASINCLDYERVTDVEVMRRNAEVIAREAPIFGKYQGFGELGCADWPVPAKPMRQKIVAAGSAPILVIGTTGDPATPYQNAVDLAASLENGHLLTYQGEGHTAYMRSNSCVQRTVDDYLLSGAVPSTDPRC